MNPNQDDYPDLPVRVLDLVDRAVAGAQPWTAWQAANNLASALMGEVSEWVDDYTEHTSVYDLINSKMNPQESIPELTWRPLNPPDPDDFLLEDQDGRIYAHAEQMDDDEWWACCYVIEAWEDPNFGSKKDAFRYCEEMARLWLFLRGRVKTLVDLAVDNRDPEHARRFDIRLEELPALPREKKE